MMTTIEKLLYLQELRLFNRFSIANLAALAQVAVEEQLADGSLVFEEGRPADHLLMLVEGKVRLEGSDRLSEEVEHEVFELAAVIAGRPHSGQGVALGECTLLKISRSDFADLLTADPIFCWETLQALAVEIAG